MAKLSSSWPLLYGISCCVIKFASLIGSRFDFDHYHLVLRSNPRQADLIIMANTITMKKAPSLVRLYERYNIFLLYILVILPLFLFSIHSNINVRLAKFLFQKIVVSAKCNSWVVDLTTFKVNDSTHVQMLIVQRMQKNSPTQSNMHMF